jgi:hypothetical protein
LTLRITKTELEILDIAVSGASGFTRALLIAGDGKQRF